MNKHFLFGLIVLGVLTPLAVSAQETYSIKEMTPEVTAALDARRDRYSQLEELKNNGSAGENNQGYVTALSPDAQSVVDAENVDRKTIYQTIAEQNELQTELETIEKVFAQVQRDKAAAGQKIQLEDGSWTVK